MHKTTKRTDLFNTLYKTCTTQKLHSNIVARKFLHFEVAERFSRSEIRINFILQISHVFLVTGLSEHNVKNSLDSAVTIP